MIDSALRAEFLVELSKIAALTDKDKKLWKDLAKKQNTFDRAHGTPGYQEALHKDNTARLGELAKKKRGYDHVGGKKVPYKTVPGWVRDPKASAPVGRAPPRAGGRSGPNYTRYTRRGSGPFGGSMPRANWKQTARALAIPAIYTAGMVGLHQYGQYKDRKRKGVRDKARRKKARATKREAQAGL